TGTFRHARMRTYVRNRRKAAMSRPQAGITNQPPDNAIFASLAFTTIDAAGTRAALDQLRELLHDELRSLLADTTPQSDKNQPSAETGELGFDDGYDRYHLTVTVGFSKSGYDKLGVAEDQQPQDLIPIPWEQLGDANVESAENGDVLLQ